MTITISGILIIAASFALRVYIIHRQPYSPKRPTGIPDSAVYIQGPNGRGLWEVCSLEANDVICTIANVGGSVLHTGKFIPYDGAALPQQPDLVITQKSGDGWISLADGRYLIPAENNEASKRYLDFMTGKTQHF